MNEVEREQKLIEDVFASSRGTKLLELLAKQYVYSTSTSLDTNAMYYHSGARDLVMHLMINSKVIKDD